MAKATRETMAESRSEITGSWSLTLSIRYKPFRHCFPPCVGPKCQDVDRGTVTTPLQTGSGRSWSLPYVERTSNGWTFSLVPGISIPRSAHAFLQHCLPEPVLPRLGKEELGRQEGLSPPTHPESSTRGSFGFALVAETVLQMLRDHTR